MKIDTLDESFNIQQIDQDFMDQNLTGTKFNTNQ